MKSFNLSDWALGHRSLVLYFMLVFLVAGVDAYLRLGREEDPKFTIKTMVVEAYWPGASVNETALQVTDRIEKKLEELDTLDSTRSVTSAGKTTVYVNLKSTTKTSEVTASWQLVRNMLNDIEPQFPRGVVGPFFNDRFGDVYGTVYAFTADGLTSRRLRDYVEDVRAKILNVPNAGRVDLIGAQEEAIYLEFSTRQIAALGLDERAIVESLRAQNAISPSGTITSRSERLEVRITGQFDSEESLHAVNLRIGNRFFRLGDLATVTRGYADPPATIFRFNGQDAIGLAIGMKANANLLKFGTDVKAEMTNISAGLPIGIGAHLVADQPAIVEEAISGFTRALFEAVGIVLAVSFVSLGMRAGFVVALSIPLVLAMTFLIMAYLGISLQRISLGALIIALGLLVDDAMIAVESMVSRLEAGDPPRKAATHVYASTAFPMLTGTLVTVAGFIPIGINDSSAGEYTRTLFIVISISLLLSWIVAVLIVPVLGVSVLSSPTGGAQTHSRATRSIYSRLLRATTRHARLTITLTMALFALSLFGLGFVQRQFFPSSDRLELMVNWNLPQSSSIFETKDEIERFERIALAGNPDIDHWSSYIGRGAVRFVLTFDSPAQNPYTGQIIVVTKNIEARSRVKKSIEMILRHEFVGTDAFVQPLELGPPVGRPVQYRISGPDIQALRSLTLDFANLISGNPHILLPTYDWNEPQRLIEVKVQQDKARKLGVTPQDIANALNMIISGSTITQIRDHTYLVNVIARSRNSERGSIDTIRNMQIPTGDGKAIPLAAIADFHYALEQPTVWRRNRIPTITIHAGVVGDVLPAKVVADLKPAVDAFIARLPAGYNVSISGSVEESAKSQSPIAAAMPLMTFVVVSILMIQLQSLQRVFLVITVAPLGLIGVVSALLPTGAPLGFVALLGVIALAGILIRNSVILVVQIERLIEVGRDRWSAVIEAAEQRQRPIVLTAAAASLALIPISREAFWEPLAFAMIGGIIAGTAITLLFLPALYITWFGIEEPKDDIQ